MRILPVVMSVIGALLVATAAPGQTAPFELRTITDTLREPLFVTSPAGDPRLFVVEQGGMVRLLEDGSLRDEPFLDIRDRVRAGGERGLLGLAFHPDYAANGQFFVNYTDRAGDTQIVRYDVSSDPDIADDGSAATVLSVAQPFGNHNGGWIGFGPDGYLWIGMGDGGGSGDRQGNGQNPEALLGKVLRIDVDGGDPYAIPPGNPFANGGGAPEVYYLGVRNPWRVAFDGDDVYIADVGQNQWEEIHVVDRADAGANLGWKIMEGFECYAPRQGCDETGLVMPVDTYSHSVGCSVTGGHVYRGAAIAEIKGLYFFADYCSGILSSWRFGDEGVGDAVSYADVFGSIGQVTSFGLDSAGELYLTTQDGRLVQFVPH